MSEKFGLFCKNCGSYKTDIHVTPEKIIVIDCLECGEREFDVGEGS